MNHETLQSFNPTSKPSKGINDHYYATVEIYHQLHCLDISRKLIRRDNYGHGHVSGSSRYQVSYGSMLVGLTFTDCTFLLLSKRDPDHCTDLLRQTLTCHSGIDLIFYTDRGDSQPAARVSTTHACRNFSELTEWVNKHDSELGSYAESSSE